MQNEREPAQRLNWHRRDWLKAGIACPLGLGLAGWLPRLSPALAAPANPTNALLRKPIRACIVVFYYGGPSHLETYDLKPDAPAEVRGEFQPIPSSVPGLQVSEHLPHMAQIMHKAAVIRSMHHGNRLHDSASTETLTGRQSPQGDREEFAPIPQFFPSYGATLSHFWRDRGLKVCHASLPWVFNNVIPVPCQGGGFLGSAYDPFRITGDPVKIQYDAEMLHIPAGLNPQRIADRKHLLNVVEAGTQAGPPARPALELDSLYTRAYDLLESEAVRQALQIDQEPAEVRQRYGVYTEYQPGQTTGAENGYGRNLRGQNLLVARRLVEAGVPFVNVYDFKQQGQNWDTHADNFNQHKKHLLPPADKALAALINDLDERGLLDSTLVVATGEFGRTPRINNSAGRDHWPDCYSLLLAGGGVVGGSIYGSSDKIGAYPATQPVTPADLAATIYWRFGLDPHAEIHDRTGRPWKLADGWPIESLFS
ncbi:MAG: DUF1501 domain-containing protein [Planctomycetes bacterium]|nr:DUF1501 domain-containing protein [Planctomycetota bacterium]